MLGEYPQLLIFNDGLKLESGEDPRLTVLKAVTAGEGNPKELTQGEYDITPEHWRRETRVNYNYNLIVNEDGTSVLRLIPKYTDAATIELRDNVSIARRGGKIINLPQDVTIVPIAGPKDGNPNNGIFIFSAVISGGLTRRP